ncbi:MAG: ATP-dependent DNA ligase [Methanosaeta sp. PtaB.Bin039]|nr:MAG: ATP-dependent DNA ligase [Methanosaeta sp. PtaB.Bin039]OPY44307.1 MAG: ATP-dependent DNA ligase [Methanosaeta sp. PtaU1.Bin028]HOT06526.1 DNA polymerase ligase N-terminal domain-containing protein [Methanotrichaceae archaeon]HQF15601.1 DNA polymerase ligase N-terminal domain-containing protein [Methanotrichaceae archaeon]HQI90337.1 DNA polymerase ligase N-terminal domain-containing protein [Methanotrichaceae archaeon]
MIRKDPLQEYRDKRDFSQTPEPPANGLSCHGEEIPGGQAMFVMHKHRSRSLHYDLRLEADCILKSWAIPKGPSTDPREKRLAVPTEDHPFAYLNFEGVIPKGEYGAGVVIVWDLGTYQNATVKNGVLVPIRRAIENGHLSFILHGRKLKGGFALTRTGSGNNVRWLLVKKNDSEASANRRLLEEEPNSVLSGQSLDEVAGAAQ